MGGFVELARNLGMARIAFIGAVAFGLLALFVFLMTRVQTPDWSSLYGDLDGSDTDAIVAELTSRQIPFQIRSGGSEIVVPREQVGPLRLELAERGFGGSIPGYELFDRDESLGQSSFQQEITKLRALEGELARTIVSLSAVRGARVHLVLPRRELFSRDTQDPTASIVLKMRGSQRLDRSQVLAVQHLVATAVPQLRPERISILDDRGTLLAGGGDATDGGLGAQSVSDLRISYENRLAQRVTELLEKTVGFGNVRVEVRADMDFSQKVVNQESFDPEQQVLRSSETIEEAASSSEQDQSTVSVGNNLPDAGANLGDGAAGNAEQSSKTEERSNFEIGKTLTNTVTPPGRVERVSVAVLVNGSRDEAGAYQERTPEQLRQIEALVRSAVAFDPARDDTIEIVNMEFEALPVDATDDERLAFGLIAEEDWRGIQSIVQTGILGLVFLLVAVLVLRPMITKVFEMREAATAAAQEAERALITDQSSAPTRIVVGDDGIPVPVPAAAADEDFDSMIDIAHIEGRVKASSMKKIGEIIEKHPEEAVSILRNWMYQDGN